MSRLRSPSRRRRVRSLSSVCHSTYSLPSRVYCSDECENNDMYSPSISSSSSVLSSPQLAYTAGVDVPSLMPSALGSALRPYAAGYPHCMSSSSSASSASWSVFTDEESQDGSRLCSSSDYGQRDPSEDPSSKFQCLINTANPSLSYIRKPSGTKDPSMVPKFKHISRSRHVRGVPKSAPNHSTVLPDEDELSSDPDFSSDPEASVHAEQDDRSTTAKMKRTRNRASLPACFSLLQIASPSKPLRESPISCSSGNTIVCQSPPTPKLLNKITGSSLHTSPTIVPLSSLHDTPRGRRREAGHSSCSRRSETPSQSRSRSRRRHMQSTEDFAAGLSPKRVFDWSTYLAGLASRGRPTVRRNRSPISRVVSEVEDAMNTGIRQSRTHPQPRGRARVEDLDGIGSSTDAPGYGRGRSGLVSRERAHPNRIPL